MANLQISYLVVDSLKPRVGSTTKTLPKLTGKSIGSISILPRIIISFLEINNSSLRTGISNKVISNIRSISRGKLNIKGISNRNISRILSNSKGVNLIQGTSSKNIPVIYAISFGNVIPSILPVVGNSAKYLAYVKGKFIGSNTVTTSPPVIISIKPDDGSVVNGTTIPITVVTKDAVYGISKVEFRINGVLKATDISSPYKYSWKPTIKGLYSITITVYNTINKSATATYTVTVV